MINIRPFMNGSLICKLWITSCGPVPVDTLITRDASIRTGQKIGLRPKVTRKSRLENRGCTHDNWGGDAFWAPDTFHTQMTKVTSVSTKYPEPSEYTQHTITPDADHPETTLQAVLWMPQGSNGKVILPQTRMYYRGWFTIQYFLEWEWSGDVLTTKKLYWSLKDGATLPTWRQNLFRYEFADGVNLPLNWARTYYGAYSQKSVSPPKEWVVPTFLQEGLMTAYSTSNHCDLAPDLILRKSDLRLATNWIRQYIPPTDINMWGDLCQEAIHDAKALDINSMQFVRELFDLKESLSGMISLMRGKPSAKSIAKTFLGLRYGLNLTFKDANELGNRIANEITLNYRKSYRYCRAMSHSISNINSGLLRNVACDQYFFYKIYYDPVDTGFRSLIRRLLDWDAFPTFQNIWDFIPFSFVLDWFVDFENYFDIVDTGGYVMYLRVLEVIETSKTIFHSVPLDEFLPINTGGWNLSGDITYTHYNRCIVPYLTLPRLRLDTPQNFRNYAELAAIIVSQTK